MIKPPRIAASLVSCACGPYQPVLPETWKSMVETSISTTFPGGRILKRPSRQLWGSSGHKIAADRQAGADDGRPVAAAIANALLGPSPNRWKSGIRRWHSHDWRACGH